MIGMGLKHAQPSAAYLRSRHRFMPYSAVGPVLAMVGYSRIKHLIALTAGVGSDAIRIFGSYYTK